MIALAGRIRSFASRESLATHDPYDVWTTAPGLLVKRWFNAHPKAALLPAAVVALADAGFPSLLQTMYPRREYPIVRALAALALMNLYHAEGGEDLLTQAARHLDWLIEHSCTGYSGPCWGLGFPYPVSPGLFYDPNTPLSTMTPYALEAFVAYDRLRPGSRYGKILPGIAAFFERDLVAMEEDAEALATSYAPFRDRTVINAVSYTMYAHALLRSRGCAPRDEDAVERISKLFAYVKRHQRSDGSWLYSPHGRPFIDCFHSAIVLKNIVKTNRIVPLKDSQAVVEAGYRFLKDQMFDREPFLFRRFALRNKPGLVRHDLYDNAECLQLAVLLGDRSFAHELAESIVRTFCRGAVIFSEMDWLGRLRRPDSLRWAVMPFLYAASTLLPVSVAARVGGAPERDRCSVPC